MSIFELKNIDCLEYIKTMPDNSVDCIITDPPYYEIKGDFDFVFKSFDEYLEWVKLLAIEFKRILKPNGSLLWFGDDKNIAYCQVIFDKHFNFLNHLVWDKIHPICKGENNFRKLATRTERILYYEHLQCNGIKSSKTGLEEVKQDVNNFKSLRDYFERVQKFIGLNLKKINEKLGHRKAEHSFYWNSTQWELPTPETYKELIDVFGIDKMEGFREYEALRQEYEALRRPFNYQLGVYEILRQQNHNNETFFITGKENHATVKPLKLIQRLIELTTNENNIVFDPFMGSGTTGIACMNLKRKFIGTELDSEYFEIAKSRVKKAYYFNNIEIIDNMIEFPLERESQLRFFKG